MSQHVLRQPLGDLDRFVRAKRLQRLPVVLTRTEVGKLLAHMHGTHGLMASLLYGTGMLLMDCIRLRVKDIDFAYNHIVVRDGKGQKDLHARTEPRGEGRLPRRCAPLALPVGLACSSYPSGTPRSRSGT